MCVFNVVLGHQDPPGNTFHCNRQRWHPKESFRRHVSDKSVPFVDNVVSKVDKSEDEKAAPNAIPNDMVDPIAALQPVLSEHVERFGQHLACVSPKRKADLAHDQTIGPAAVAGSNFLLSARNKKHKHEHKDAEPMDEDEHSIWMPQSQ